MDIGKSFLVKDFLELGGYLKDEDLNDVVFCIVKDRNDLHKPLNYRMNNFYLHSTETKLYVLEKSSSGYYFNDELDLILTDLDILYSDFLRYDVASNGELWVELYFDEEI